jgi:hypothetical protein
MSTHRIGIIGGAGKEGAGLAVRLAAAGHRVTIGSRDRDRAREAAAQLSREANRPVAMGDNREAAAASDVVILTVPFAAQLATLEGLRAELQGKILIDATAPLIPPRLSRVQLPKEGSAALMAQALLGDGVRVVSAFQNVSAHHLRDLSRAIETDVIVCGDDQEACDIVIGIAGAIGIRGFYGGALCNSAAAEALVSVLIVINRRYKIAAAGIKITGAPS